VTHRVAPVTPEPATALAARSRMGAGVARHSEAVARTPQQTLQEAQKLLDAGRPFHAHEVFEDAWKAARDAPQQVCGSRSRSSP
jgi:uncharacterized protein